MIIPRFTLTQDDDFIYIAIKAPYAKITADSEPEIYIDENEFKFYAKPYYLRLHLPGKLLEDGQESAIYESGYFLIKYSKFNKGENFQNLDMLTKLLTIPKRNISAPKIEVLECKKSISCGEDIVLKDVEDDDNYDEDDEENDDFHFDQKLDPEITICNDLIKPKYGFANLYDNLLNNVQEELNVLSIKNINDLQMTLRREKRILKEQNDFNEDYYLADYFENDYIDDLIEFSTSKFYSQSNYLLTEEENYILHKLPRKEYILSKSEELIAIYSLVDILFAYAYNLRTTEGENTVESGWTICTLSGTLSWLDYFTTLKEALICCYRRALIYPLYRNFKLCQTVFQDTLNILKNGRIFILKCLIEIRSLLVDSDDRYILNELYINDYCVWIQSICSEKIDKVLKELELMTMNKLDLGLDLEVLEAAGQVALNKIDDDDSTDQSESSGDSTD